MPLIRRLLLLLPVLLLSTPAVAGPFSVLNSTSHAKEFIAPAINAVSSGKVDTSIFVDYVPAGFSVFPGPALTDTGASYVSVASGLTVNHAPYLIGNASFSGYSLSLDQQLYAQLVAANGTQSQPLAVRVNSPLPAGTAPPSTMMVGSSVNSSNGGTGDGIEFGLSASYKGLDTTTDSWVSAEIAGFGAVLALNHPTWNVWDIKTALRVTADHWATGYDPAHFGYGLIDWDSANAGPTLYLQSPGIKFENHTNYAVVTLFPYRQTRRAHEVIYSVSAAYVWPVKNEYTTTDITASGATLLYTSNGTDVEPQYVYVPAMGGTISFVAFTTDGSGNYSRVEEFSVKSQTFAVNACH